LDIIYLINIILDCYDCVILCGDINSDNQLDLLDIIFILNIIIAN